IAVFELLVRPESHVAATVLSTMPSQSSSTMLPGASNAPGLTSFGSPQPSVVASQQSPPHVVKPSPSASASSSTMPLQLSSTLLPQTSPVGTTSPAHAPQLPPLSHVCVPPVHGPTPCVPDAPV